MEASLFALALASRTQREECKETKHDSQFSKWQVLVGPSDWENHSLGKEGANRYRFHSLPKGTDSGLYELGIAVPRAGSGRSVDKFDSDGVIVVYLGQADSIRTRLQCYGRNGDHLNSPNGCGLGIGLGCFEDIFSRGCSIVFRWAPKKNKTEALKTERELLNKFDYAWNKTGNERRRHDDVLRKLKTVASNSIQLPKSSRRLPYFNQMPAGIKLKASMLPSMWKITSNYADEEGHYIFPQNFKYTKSQLRLVLDRHGADEGYTSICGVTLGDDSVCRRPPVEGRKRCDQHRGMKVSAYASIPTLSIKGKAKAGDADPMKLPLVTHKCPVSEGFSSIRGVILDNVHDADFDSNAGGALNSPELYRQGRVQPRVTLQCETVCGVELENGIFCTRQPVEGRVRCEEHKELKIKENKSASAAQEKSNLCNGGSSLSTCYPSSVCGALTLDDSYCRRSVKGNTRCWQHSGYVTDQSVSIRSGSDWSYGGSSQCGACTVDGSYCRRSVKGGGRCWQHSGYVMDQSVRIRSGSDWSYGGSSQCGARTVNGSYCRRTVKGGGRCWQH